MPQLTRNPKQIAAAGRHGAGERSRAPARRVPATRDEAAAALERLALLRSGLAERMARLDADIAVLTAQAAADSEALLAEAQEVEEAVRLFCEAHRKTLTRDGRVKTVSFSAGSVAWRLRPASIEISDESAAIAALDATDLAAACVVATRRVSKSAVLQLGPERIAGLDGLRYVAGVEDCVVKTRSA